MKERKKPKDKTNLGNSTQLIAGEQGWKIKTQNSMFFLFD